MFCMGLGGGLSGNHRMQIENPARHADRGRNDFTRARISATNCLRMVRDGAAMKNALGAPRGEVLPSLRCARTVCQHRVRCTEGSAKVDARHVEVLAVMLDGMHLRRLGKDLSFAIAHNGVVFHDDSP